MTNTESVQNFEDSLKELENLVKLFEEGQLTLDQAIAAYERGLYLKEYCFSKLQQAKAKIESVMAEKTSRDAGSSESNTPENDPAESS